MYLEKLSPNRSEFLVYFSLVPLNEKTKIDPSYLKIAGWVVGKKSKAVKVELVCDHQVIQQTAVDHLRPDVGKVYPQVAGSEKSGFSMTIDVRQLPPEAELKLLMIQAVLEDESRVALAKVQLQQSLLSQLQKVQEKIDEGNQLSTEGKLSQAIEKYREVLQINSEYIPALQGLGDALANNGQMDEALTTYRQAIELNPDNLYGYQQLRKLGYLDEFYQCCQQALRNNPNHITLKKFYLPFSASQRIPKGELKKSLEILNTFVEKEATNIDILINAAILARNAGEINEAENYIKTALNLDRDHGSALSEMGKILEEKQKWQEAIDYYQQCKKPQNTVSLLTCIYNSFKFYQDNFNQEIERAIKRSKTITFINQEILSKLDIKYEEHLILYQGASNVGDTCKYLALIKPLCIQHNRKAIVFYHRGHSPETQAHLFLDPIMPRYVTAHFPIDQKMQHKIQELMIEDGFSLDQLPIRPGVPRRTIGTFQMQELNYITDESIYQAGAAACLGINIELNDDTMGKPVIKEQSLVNAVNKFDNLKLVRGKAILIAPHSVTLNLSTGSNSALIPFWRKIINALIEKNITPVINAKHNQEKLDYLSTIVDDYSQKQIKFIDLPLDEVIPFIELCGAFAGVRSGLCDLVAFSSQNITKLCVQPRQSDSNCFGKLPGVKIFDNDLINNNFYLYFLSIYNPPEDEQINQLVELFLDRNPAET